MRLLPEQQAFPGHAAALLPVSNYWYDTSLGQTEAIQSPFATPWVEANHESGNDGRPVLPVVNRQKQKVKLCKLESDSCQ